MRTFIASLICVCIISITGIVTAQPSWGPTCYNYDYTQGRVYWNGADNPLFNEGLRGGFERFGDTANFWEDGDILLVRNTARYDVWLRNSNGYIQRLAPVETWRSELTNNGGGVYFELIHCLDSQPMPDPITRTFRSFLPTGRSRSFPLVINSTSVVTITMDSNDFDCYINLWDHRRLLDSNDDGGVGLNSRMVIMLDPGTYSIETISYMNNGGGEFTLRVSIQTM